MANIIFRKCYPEHIICLHIQDVQAAEQRALLTGIDETLRYSTIAQSAWVDERCVAAAGLIEFHRGRATAWALLSREATMHMLPITRRIKIMLDTSPIKRIEMVVLADFEQGHRWARMLGFKRETPEPMEAYFPDGSAGVQYARIRTWQQHSQSLAA